MKIYSVYDPEFKPYGKALEGFDTDELIAALREFPIPESGVEYEPSVERLERLPIFVELRDRVYGGMPIELGMARGWNTKLNGVEYHRNSEINIGEDEFVVLLAKLEQIEDGFLDTSLIKAFRVPAGVPVELYATTLHYCPCVRGAGFRVACALPRGTNGSAPVFEPKCDEDRRIAGCNIWVLVHPDTDEAKEGMRVGLRGVNIDIAAED